MNRVLKFINLLRVEPYLFLVQFQAGLHSTADRQVLEDKICRNWYNQTHDYCYDVPTSDETGDEPNHYKAKILSDATMFNTYPGYVTTVPIMIWTALVGAFIDRYVRARKLTMMLPIGALVVETVMKIYLSLDFSANVYYNLIPYIPSALFGGRVAYMVASIHYMTSMTPPKMLAIRFMIFEMSNYTGQTIGLTLGGYLLVQKPVFSSGGEIRNYTLIYIIALASQLIAIVWVQVMVDEVLARRQELKIEKKKLGITDSCDNTTPIRLRSDMSAEDKDRHPLTLFFDIENVKQMVRTCIKSRPNKARTQMLLIFLCWFTFIMTSDGLEVITSAFYQEVHHFSPDILSYLGAITSVTNVVVSLTIVPLIVKVFKVADISLALIGFVSDAARCLLIGTWLTHIAIYISITVTSLGTLVKVGMRAHLTQIVDSDEIGKVMCMMAIMDTLSTWIAKVIYAFVFKHTITTYPGLAYQMSALVMIVSMYVIMWIDLAHERRKGNTKIDTRL